MKTKTTTKQTASDAYEIAVTEAIDMADELANDIRENWPAPGTEGIYWATVGSMAAIMERLRETRAFIRCEDEDEDAN